MQRIKRMLAYILAFAMVFTALPQNAYVYATETNNEERGTIVEGQTVTASNATDSNATNPNADSPIVSVELESKPVSEYIFQCQTKTGYGMNSDKIFNGLKLKVTFVNDTSQTTEIDSIGETRFVYYKTGTMGAGTPFSVNFKGWEKMEDGYANLGDNAAIFNVGGKEYSLPVKISEDPVKEMTIIKNPEKIQYEPFKENIADLYGAEIKIVYKDNKEEVVKITEHDNYVETIGRYGFSLYSSINTNPSQLSLNVYYINESCPVNISVSDIASAIDDTLTDSIWISHQVQDKKSKLYKVEPQNDITYHAFLLSGSMTINVYNQYLPYKLDYLSQNEPVSISLEGGKTYYIVTSSSMGNDAIAYVTNNENLSRNDIKISSYGISDIPAAHRYTFEDSIYANFGIELQGTAYYITYSAENTEYTSYGVFGGFYQLLSNNQYSLHGMPLSLKWKKTEMRYGAEYVTVSNDNAIIYNWGGKEAEIPASFDKETPVESITIIKNPFVDKVFYGMNAYQEMQKYLSEILFQINYKDGTKSEELSFQDNSQSAYIDGYIAQLTNISTSIGINCAKLTYMGCEADVEYEVGEIPIKDIKFSKAPNNIYICFPLGATLDLFGAEITIEYLDDTSETVKVESHGTSITFEGKYGYGSIWANYMFGADNTAPIILSYMQETITTSTYIEAVSEGEYLKHVTLPELSVGEIQFSPKQNGNSVLYEFVPEETAEYTISWQDTNPMYSSIKSMYIRNSSCVVLASAFSPTTSCSAKLEAGKVYYISLSGGSDCIFTFSRGKVITQNIIPSVSINSSEMNIGDALPNLSIPAEDEGYTIVSEKWNTSDTTVNGASVYKATIVLTPNENYKFTRDTVAEFKIGDLKKGKVTKSLSTNGNLTLVCTYLKTPSVITFKGDSGKYVLANPQKNTVENNGDYVFKYIASQDAIDTQNIIIKVDGNIISPVELNYNDPLATDTNATSGKVYMYTIPNVTNNKEVAVKIIDKNSSTDNANVKVDLYNKGQNEGDKYDSIEVKKGDSISQNESDNKLPVLQSYNGDNNFFFGWYMEIASGGNGKGQRFLSTTEVNNNTKIYARWENGIFEFGSNPRTQYKITSIDENNNMKVELIKYSINLARLTAGVTAYTIANLTATEDNIANIPDSISAREALANYDIAGNMEIASIGEGAFEGSNVTKIELPNTVEKIEANAFKGCTSLESIALPETIETIEAGTFDGCTSLKTVEIPEGVTSIGEDVFKGCTSLKTVSIPDTVESIAETAFDNGNSSLPITVVCSDETAEIVKNAASEKVNVLSVNLSTNVDSLEFSKHSKRFNVTPYLEVKNGETTLDNNNYDITPFLSDEAEKAGYSCTKKDGKYAVSFNSNSITEDEYKLYLVVKDIASQNVVGKTSVSLNTVVMSIDEGQYEVYVDDQVYSGAPLMPVVSVFDENSIQLYDESDYNVSYTNNINAGTATATITGKGWYTGTITKTFTIEKADKSITVPSTTYSKTVGDASFSLGASTATGESLTYTSSNSAVATVDTYGTVTVVGAGTAEITISSPASANFNAADDVTVTINVAAAPVQPAPEKKTKSITVSATSYNKTVGDAAFSLGASTAAGESLTYTSSNTAVATVDANGTVTVVAAGTAVITITSAESTNYKAAEPVNVTINVAAAPQPEPAPQQPEPQPQQKAAKTIKVSKKSYTVAVGSKALSLGAKTATGEKVRYATSDKKVVTVTALGKVTVKGIGTATITLTSPETAKYKAAKPVKVTITVTPKKASLSSLKNEKGKKLKVTWKKDTSVTGYEILYSQKSNFKGAKKVTVAKNKTVSATIKKLTKNKTYYVKVRAYKTVKGKKIYGAYSSVKKVKVTK